jgi:hypothetical protein
MKREIAKSRPESRPRPRQRRDFFLRFMFELRNRRELSNLAQTRSRSRRKDFSSVRNPARSLSRPIHTPPQQPTPLKSQELCVQWRFRDLIRTCGHHMVTLVRGERSPHPLSTAPPLIPPILPPPPISWCVVCLLCVVHTQCCQVPKKFPASTSKKFGQFRKKLGKFPKTSISQCLVY